MSELAENLFQFQPLSLLRNVSTDVAKLGLLECAGGGIWGEHAILCIVLQLKTAQVWKLDCI
jgi:hypothetical protein